MKRKKLNLLRGYDLSVTFHIVPCFCVFGCHEHIPKDKLLACLGTSEILVPVMCNFTENLKQSVCFESGMPVIYM